MTRKDYVLIAEAVAEGLALATTKAQKDAVRSTAESITQRLQKDNPRFDRWRFMEACGFPPTV